MKTLTALAILASLTVASLLLALLIYGLDMRDRWRARREETRRRREQLRNIVNR
jgi:hypothetical protein